MAYAEPILDYIDLLNKDTYENLKKIELSKSELIGLRALKSMGNKEATQTLADYYLSDAIF